MENPILSKADSLVSGARNDKYGHPYYDYKRSTEMFNALTGHNLSIADGPLFMICVKLSRNQHKYDEDNLVDTAGYTACQGLIHHMEETMRVTVKGESKDDQGNDK